MPALQKEKISKLLIEHYQKQTDLDKRLERLEGMVAAAEKQSHDLIGRAQMCAETNNFQQYDHIIKKAQKLQNHITHIIKVIIRTEKKLSALAYKIVRDNINLTKNV